MINRYKVTSTGGPHGLRDLPYKKGLAIPSKRWTPMFWKHCYGTSESGFNLYQG